MVVSDSFALWSTRWSSLTGRRAGRLSAFYRRHRISTTASLWSCRTGRLNLVSKQMMKLNSPMVARLVVLCSVSMAPGAETLPVNPNVTPENIDLTICVKGFSHSIRPPWQFTNSIKHRLLDEAGIPSEAIHEYVLDHVINIAIGGAPDDPRNLRLQPREESLQKDRAENRAHDLVCTHRLGLREAQRIMWSDWRRMLPHR